MNIPKLSALGKLYTTICRKGDKKKPTVLGRGLASTLSGGENRHRVLARGNFLAANCLRYARDALGTGADVISTREGLGCCKRQLKSFGAMEKPEEAVGGRPQKGRINKGMVQNVRQLGNSGLCAGRGGGRCASWEMRREKGTVCS